jgi:predicted secreted protein
MSRRTALAASFALVFALAAPWAASADLVARPVTVAVVNISSSATIEVAKDLLSVTFNTTREGADAAVVQSQLKQALDAALAEARKAARPGQLDVQTGNFSLSPRYTNKGVVNGWQGSAELLVEGRDMAAIGQLTGRITTLTIARVSYGLSRELRERSEGEVAAQAITRYRAKAAEYTKQFGYADHAIRDVNVSSVEQPGPNPRVMMMSRATAATMPEEALPIEAGKGTLTVSVTGTVQMTK